MFILDTYQKITCGNVTMPYVVAQITSLIILVIQIVVPLLIIILGMLDLGKAVVAQKEDEIKKGWQTFIKRMIAAAIVFFVVVIVQLVLNLVGGDSKDTVWNCVDCFISNNCE